MAQILQQGYIAYENEAGITNTLANQNLGWEKTAQWNIGVDFNFFNGRINGIVDVYTSKTTDLLMAQSILLPDRLCPHLC
ncbi:MAG: hypothetical protein ACLUVG_16600 [Phocaeicola vulgatus]